MRDCMCEEIYPNIFSGEEKKQHAKITYLKNGASLTYKWLGEGYCENLCSVEIFDTTFGQVFTEREGEVCYEPPILAFFSLLSKVSEKVTEKLKAKEENYKSEMPRFPESLEGTIAADWLKKLRVIQLKKISIVSVYLQMKITKSCIFFIQDCLSKIHWRNQNSWKRKRIMLMSSSNFLRNIMNNFQMATVEKF